MKAIRVRQFGPPEVLQLETLPDLVPGTGEVVVRLHAIGVNPVDTYIRSGSYAKKPQLPYTPGSDAAGVIESIGAEVPDLKPGQRVYVSASISGTYADACLCLAAAVHPLPECVSFAQGAALGIPYATAYYALFLRGCATPGETVLIHGATGGVGTAAVQLARAAGLTVFGTGSSPEGLQLALDQGAHQVFDHSTPSYTDAILQNTGGRGPDLILEMLANVNLARDLALLAPNGRIAIVGSRGPLEINPRDLMIRNADIRGVMLSAASPQQLLQIHSALRAGLENRTLRPVIGSQLPLHDAHLAHLALFSAPAKGKIILLPSPLSTSIAPN